MLRKTINAEITEIRRERREMRFKLSHYQKFTITRAPAVLSRREEKIRPGSVNKN
jgi:hypothetical protein